MLKQQITNAGYDGQILPASVFVCYNQVSISSTLYAHLFCTNVVFPGYKCRKICAFNIDEIDGKLDCTSNIYLLFIRDPNAMRQK